MGTILPTAASSAVLLIVNALSFGLIGLLERGGQRGSELVIVVGLLKSVATFAFEYFCKSQET
jgi:hypothetical protein